MKKTMYGITSIIMLLVMMVGKFSSAQAAPEYAAFYQRLAIGSSSSWNFEESGSQETITASSDGWLMKAGGYASLTHYARVKYRLPENAGKVLKTFYMKAVIVLPPDFYTQQKSSFRLLNTDNFGTTLNGAQVGAPNTHELRASVYIWGDHKLYLIMDHEDLSKKTLYVSSAPLPLGEHTFEVYGNLAEVAPWYFKVDGAVVASGVDRLSPDSVPANERVATRIVAGIDGAYAQDQNSMSVVVKSVEIADYDMSGSTIQKPTATPIQPTATKVIQPTATQVIQPTAIVSTNSAPAGTYDDKDTRFVYSSGWTTATSTQAYGGSHRETTQEGATVTFPFTGSSFSLLYKGGVSFSQFDVYVDGTKVGTVNQNYSVASYQLRWDSSQFAQGNHTLKLVFHATSSTKIRGSVDAVIVRSTTSPATVAPTATRVQPTNTPLPVVPTLTNTPVPASASEEQIVDDKDMRFVYSSGWTTATSTQAYGGSHRETTVEAATVTFPFTGNSFSLLYKGGVSFSQFDVYVDGTKVGTVNQNYSVATYQLRWNSPQFAQGNHTLKLVFHATSSTKIRGSVDAVIVRSTAGSVVLASAADSVQEPTATAVILPTNTPVPPTATAVILPTETAVAQPTNTPVPNNSTGEQIFDDKNAAFVYSDGWTTAASAEAYGGSHRETTMEGATATFPFTGSSFSIIYKGGTSFDQFDVLVDGTKIGTLNENYSTATYQLRWDSPQLTQGNHTLQLVFHVTTEVRGSLDAVIVR